MPEDAPKVLLGMTGGVDSSLSAWLLKRDGYQVVGVTLLFHDAPSIQKKIEHAKDVAESLGIEHHVVDLTERFATEVKAQTLAGIEAGRYPFPCSICTPGLKIPALFECAREYGCDKVATGHYARITTDEEFGVGLLDYQLRVPFDKHKDQTYLLYRLTQEQLSRLIFPLADIHKGVVRRMAMQHGVMQFAPVEDGQGTPCFFGDGSFADWLEGEGGIVPTSGSIVSLVDAKKVGAHEGLHRYEPGQEVDGRFVITKDVERNELLVGPRNLASFEMCQLKNVHWTSVEPLSKKRSCRARFTADGHSVPVKITPTADGVAVLINETMSGLVEGQDVVLYSDDLVLGGGTIAY